MSIGRPKSALVLSEDERIQVSSLARSRTLPHAIVARAKVVLWSAEGASNTEIAGRLQWTKATVGKWRRRFLERRLPGLYDELRPGRPRSIEDEQVAALLKRTLSRKPRGGTHWTVREAAQVNGISKSTVHRLFQAFAVQPHRTRSFKLSTDPFFIEKVRDIVGLYLNPPDHALVLCVDEKSQIQALNRTQPVLPMGLGYVEGVTHDYVRHGTTTLFAALDIATGTVFTECKPRHRHQEFLAFLRRLDDCIPTDLDVHLIVDNYATHKHPKVRTWLAQRPRYQIHYTHLLVVVESGGTVVRTDHPASDSPRLISKCKGIGGEDRLLRPALQPLATALRLERNSRFHSRQNRPTLFTYFRDTTLGLPFLFQTPKMAFFDCDGVRLMLGTEEAGRRTFSSLIYFKVREIEAGSAELRSRGVIFERDPHLVARLPDHDLWMAFFRDPDGNALALICEKPRPSLGRSGSDPLQYG